MAAKGLFEVAKLDCIRGNRMLFQNLSFALSAGDVAHVSGPNGAGKTSLLLLLAGALQAQGGKVFWRGDNVLENDGAKMPDFSFLPADDRNLKPLETAYENLMFWAQLWGVAGAQKKAIASLKRMDLSRQKDVPVKYLSSGQRRRLSLARVFLKDAPLWFLDEPLNGLDIHAYDLFMTALHEHTDAGGMAVIASHFAIEPPKNGKLHRVDVGYA